MNQVCLVSVQKGFKMFILPLVFKQGYKYNTLINLHAGITVLMTVFGFGCYTHDMIYSIIHIHKNRYESEINQIHFR